MKGMIRTQVMTKWAGGDGAATVGCIWLMEILTRADTSPLIVYLLFVFLCFFALMQFWHLIDGSPSASRHLQINSRPTPLSICVLLMCFLRVHVRKYVIKHMMHFSGSLPPCVIVPAIGCIWLMEVLTLADSPRLIVVQANIIVSLFSKRADRPFHLVSPCTCTCTAQCTCTQTQSSQFR